MAFPLIAALIGAAVLGGIGKAIGAIQQRKGQKETASLQALGPVRGGSERAGNQGLFGFDPSTLEQLGQTSLPIKYPGMDQGQPIDFGSLFQPRPFGTGFRLSGPEQRYSLPNVPRRINF